MRLRRTAISAALPALALAACGAVTVTLPQPPARLALPVRIEDLRAEKYGVWPFGVHGGGHPEGHGGFDFELARDAAVVAAADGRVERVEASRDFPGQFDVGLVHDELGLRTSYGHLRDVPASVARGATVRAGDLLGRPSWRDDEGFAMIHFSVGDPRSDAPFGEVCPLERLARDDAARLEAYWARLPASRKSPHEPSLCNERVLASRTGDPLVGSWFAIRPRVRPHPLILTLTEFDAPGGRAFASTERDGRPGSGVWRREGDDLVLAPESGGGGGEARRLRVRLEAGVLVLGSGGDATSYDRRFRSVAAEGE